MTIFLSIVSYSYLREKDLKAGWINKYANTWKDDFPETTEAFDTRLEQLQQDRKASQETKQQNHINELTATIEQQQIRITELEQQAMHLQADNTALQQHREQDQAALAESQQQIGALSQKTSALEA